VISFCLARKVALQLLAYKADGRYHRTRPTVPRLGELSYALASFPVLASRSLCFASHLGISLSSLMRYTRYRISSLRPEVPYTPGRVLFTPGTAVPPIKSTPGRVKIVQDYVPWIGQPFSLKYVISSFILSPHVLATEFQSCWLLLKGSDQWEGRGFGRSPNHYMLVGRWCWMFFCHFNGLPYCMKSYLLFR
jgi:hypothetical protein